MKYFIEDITNLNGETRTDDRYPNRIGSTIEFLQPVEIGKPAYFKYIKYENDELIEHITRTSLVNELKGEDDKVFMYTENSIYIIKSTIESEE